jgi:serine/threonine-protein kinase
MIAPGATMSMAGTVAWQSVLPIVERQLAQYVGPMARVYVKKAAAKTSDPEELYRILAANLERESDREAFLKQRANVGRLFATAAPAHSGASEPSMVVPAGSKPMEFSHDELDRAARLLARHIGPISRVLVKKAAASANSLPAFYQSLAAHVQTKADRAKFLRDAGHPEQQ